MCSYFRLSSFRLHPNTVWKLLSLSSLLLMKWFCAHVTEWVTEIETQWICLQAPCYEQRPGRHTQCVCISSPQERTSSCCCWMFLAALISSQPASSGKPTTHNYPVQPLHHFLQVGIAKDLVSVATLLPGDSEGGPGRSWCLRNDRNGQRQQTGCNI